MQLEYRKMTDADREILTRTRITVLRAANRLSEEADMTQVEERTRSYYSRALRDGSHAAYLVFDGERFVGAGAVSFYRVMPTYCNPSGEKGYIMNMYTDPAYRRRGIASRTLALLVQEAKRRGVTFLSLEATDMGRPVYEKYGFTEKDDEMMLRL